MSEVCVRVAARIRPLLHKEVLHHHQVCVRVVPGSEQVMVGSDRCFSFDHAFGPTASQDQVYESCVQPLVESLLDGHNATVFCYGQTGSGKTYTLGGGNQEEEGGIIDRVAHDVFFLLERMRQSSDDVEVTVRLSYLELYKEELRDLLELHIIPKELHIREDEKGNTVVVGAKEVVITSAEELLSILEMGNALRHTAATGMNEHSSRSHAILTLQVIQGCHSNSSSQRSFRSSKLCLVDLAGSERAGKTGNTGTQLKESSQINTGLLALGNVIRALSDQSRRGSSTNSAHIPYRDAKITRLLRDSLGGTAHTLMVACVSPSHLFVAETLSVLQFASKARHIRNRPKSMCTQAVSFPTNWHPDEARLGELEYEVQTLRELLKEKEREVQVERAKTGLGGETDNSTQSRASEPDMRMKQEEPPQYHALAQEAAALLAEASGLSSRVSFRKQVQNWQERLTEVNHAHQTYDKDVTEQATSGDQTDHVAILKLREELKKCQEALHIREQQLEQKDAELRQVQKEVENLLLQRKTLLVACEEEKEHTCVQKEQLVNQQIVIDPLRSKLMTFEGTTSGSAIEAAGASGYADKRPNSVPVIGLSWVGRLPRKIHSSPPAYSLERVMAAFKMRGHLLLAEMEEKDEVYRPFMKQQAQIKDSVCEEEEEEEEEENEGFLSRVGFRRSLNRTWTSRHKKSALKEKIIAPDQICDGSPVLQPPQQATGKSENQSQTRKARRTVCATERRIQDLSGNMRMKEELIKELDKTDKEALLVDRLSRHTGGGGGGEEGGVLERLSKQNHQVREGMYRSLQLMRLQRAQLQRSLRETTSDRKELLQNGEHRADLVVCGGSYPEGTNKKLHDSSWLEEEEEEVIQKRAELQVLEEDLMRREELLLRREACLQRKNKLEIKKLRSSQALSQDLLRVSTQLESLEEQLQSNSVKTGGVTIQELEKEKDMLKRRRDTLDSQLKDNRVLTAEEEHSLLQLEEAIEALDAAVEYKNHSIQDKKKRLFITDSSLHQSQNTEPAQLCDVISKLKELSPRETLQLLVKYFNKVVCLREVERNFRLRCEELELHAGEQERVLKQMEAAMLHLTLDADRRLTQQHQDHQNNIQQLLQKLKEGVSEEAQQSIQDRLQHLEKELFFYKSSSRQLKKKLREIVGDNVRPCDQTSHSQENRKMHNIKTGASEHQNHTDEVQTRTHIPTTYIKIHAEQSDKNTRNDSHMNRYIHQTPSSSADCHALKNQKRTDNNQKHAESPGRIKRGQPFESLEMIPVRVCCREVRQISAADLQVSGSATRRRQSVVDSSTESTLEDSIELPRRTGDPT